MTTHISPEDLRSLEERFTGAERPVQEGPPQQAIARREFLTYKRKLERAGAMAAEPRKAELEDVRNRMLSVAAGNEDTLLGTQGLIYAARAAFKLAFIGDGQNNWRDDAYGILNRVYDSAQKNVSKEADHCEAIGYLTYAADIAWLMAGLTEKRNEKFVLAEQSFALRKRAAERCPGDSAYDRFFGITCSSAARDATFIAEVGGDEGIVWMINAYEMRRTAEEALRRVDRMLGQNELFAANGIALQLQETHPNHAERLRWSKAASDGRLLMSRIYSRR